MNISHEMEKKIPKVNWYASKWQGLLNLTDAAIMEPPTTQHFSKEEIQTFMNNNTKPDIPDLPCHSKGVKRSLELVTEAMVSTIHIFRETMNGSLARGFQETTIFWSFQDMLWSL